MKILNNKQYRLVIYAAYNKKGLVESSDIYYLEALKEITDLIIYVADNELNLVEKDKLRPYTSHILAQHHGEYDFGSYKRGFFYAKEYNLLQDMEEVIFCNDSCYAPLYPFAPIFDKMQQNTCDFWSLTENYEFSRHLQSFFLVFRAQVFNNELFQEFLSSVTAQQYVQQVIQKYEIGLSTFLLEHGFKAESYIPYPTDAECPQLKGRKINLTQFPLWLIKHGCPLLKKKALYDYVANKDGFVKTYFMLLYHNIKLRHALPPVYKLYIADILKYKRFFFQKKITYSGKLLIKICKIPVYSKKLGGAS